MESLRRLEAFVHTARSGSFTKAGAALGLDPTSVSRAVTELEEELGVILVQRSTRSLRLTDDGAAFHERVARLLDDLAEAKRSVSASTSAPSGTLRVDAPVALGRSRIAPIVLALSRTHPALVVHLTLHDRFVDPRTEDVDILVRLNGPREPSLVARPLGESRMVVCASKRVIARHGKPRSPNDLSRMPCLGYLRHGKPEPWRLRLPKEGGKLVQVVPRGAVHSDDGDLLRDAALADAGFVWMLDFMVSEHLASGALVEVLRPFAHERRRIEALHPSSRLLLPRVRVMLDALSAAFSSP